MACPCEAPLPADALMQLANSWASCHALHALCQAALWEAAASTKLLSQGLLYNCTVAASANLRSLMVLYAPHPAGQCVTFSSSGSSSGSGSQQITASIWKCCLALCPT